MDCAVSYWFYEVNQRSTHSSNLTQPSWFFRREGEMEIVTQNNHHTQEEKNKTILMVCSCYNFDYSWPLPSNNDSIPQHMPFNCTLILFTHLRSTVLPSSLLAIILYIFSFNPLHVSCGIKIIHLDSFTPVVAGGGTIVHLICTLPVINI